MVENPLSKTQVDRLGERLRRLEYGEGELRSLDEYRRTFGPAYDRVVERIHAITGVPVSGRPAKSTSSIIEKLNRESIRLSQMQDIAGCRTIVADVAEQDHAVSAITSAFERVNVVDRRTKPSHGCRAVHLVVYESDKVVEVQVRTALQHAWAEMCEKCADTINPALKYGGGPEPTRSVLDRTANQIQQIENIEAELAKAGIVNSTLSQELRDLRNAYTATLQDFLKDLSEGDGSIRS